jgi:hypothetical protein
VFEMGLRPVVDGVILDVGEGPASERNDTHDHARILQILSDQFQLLRTIAPLTHDLRRL